MRPNFSPPSPSPALLLASPLAADRSSGLKRLALSPFPSQRPGEVWRLLHRDGRAAIAIPLYSGTRALCGGRNRRKRIRWPQVFSRLWPPVRPAPASRVGLGEPLQHPQDPLLAPCLQRNGVGALVSKNGRTGFEPLPRGRSGSKNLKRMSPYGGAVLCDMGKGRPPPRSAPKQSQEQPLGIRFGNGVCLGFFAGPGDGLGGQKVARPYPDSRACLCLPPRFRFATFHSRDRRLYRRHVQVVEPVNMSSRKTARAAQRLACTRSTGARLPRFGFGL